MNSYQGTAVTLWAPVAPLSRYAVSRIFFTGRACGRPNSFYDSTIDAGRRIGGCKKGPATYDLLNKPPGTRMEPSLGRACAYLPVVAMLACPNVA
jgi:hypothetical protein